MRAQPGEPVARTGRHQPGIGVRPGADDELWSAARGVQSCEVLEHPGKENVVPAADELHRRADLRDSLGEVARDPVLGLARWVGDRLAKPIDLATGGSEV